MGMWDSWGPLSHPEPLLAPAGVVLCWNIAIPSSKDWTELGTFWV